jgi:hypothetical protein
MAASSDSKAATSTPSPLPSTSTKPSPDFRTNPKVGVIADGSFRLQYASDLHLEMFQDKDIIYRIIKPAAPYLVLVCTQTHLSCILSCL